MFILRALCHDVHNAHTHVWSENTSTWSYINKEGGEKHTLKEVTRYILLWAQLRQVWLTTTHLPGTLNKEADILSRQSHGWKSEWQLETKVVRRIDHTVGPLEIDLFASRLNHQCEKYISWHTFPATMAIDAFQSPWTNAKLYASPPFSVLGQQL